jgi:hypothetical protein
MSADPNKKIARTFQCREVLWDAFEQMARELECSVDYLVNEAMKQYARQRSHGVPRTPYPPLQRVEPSVPGPPSQPQPPLPAGRMPTSPGGRPPSFAAALPPPPSRPLPPPGRSLPSMPMPPHRAVAGHSQPAGVRAPPGMPALPGTSPPIGGAAAPNPSVVRSMMPPAPVRTTMPPLPGGTPTRSVAMDANSNGQVGPSALVLTLVYNGERFPVTKDRFVIGRGKQSSDLTLKDPNVSRQHALVEFDNGSYFMVDMGSTNGVTYNGQRIARKAIAEGDLFRICDHDLRFTYR